MLLMIVEKRAAGVVWCGDGEYQLESGSAQKGSRSTDEGHRGPPGARTSQRGRRRVVSGELGRLAAVDEWEQDRILEIRAEGERGRHEHRQFGAAAARMQGRGETLAAIAKLAGVKVSDVRTVLKSTSAQPVAARDALGVAESADAAPVNGPATAEGASQALGVGERV